MTHKQFIKKLQECKEKIAAERDKLRDLISEAEDLADSAHRAIDCMEEAADYLSELV